MNDLHTPVSNLPGIVLRDIKRDVGEPTRKDYTIQCGSQSGAYVDSKLDAFVLLTLERGEGRGEETLLEVNLTPEQARTMAAKLLHLADACDKVAAERTDEERAIINAGFASR